MYERTCTDQSGAARCQLHLQLPTARIGLRPKLGIRMTGRRRQSLSSTLRALFSLTGAGAIDRVRASRTNMRVGLLLLTALAAGAYGQNGSLVQSGIVAGTVVDAATNNPVPGAMVRLRQGASQEPRIDDTDGSGRFKFADVPFGQFILEASAPGFFRSGKHARTYSFRLSRPTLPPNAVLRETTVTEVLTLERCGVIFGKVTDPGAGLAPNGSIRPATQTKVELLQLRPRGSSGRAGSIFAMRRGLIGKDELVVVAWTPVNDQGEYRSDDLDAGTYYLVAHPISLYIPPPSPVSAKTEIEAGTPRTTYLRRSLRASGATPITIAAGEEPRNLDLEIVRQRGVRVTGRLVFPSESRGKPYIHVFVSIWPDGVPGEMMPIPHAPMGTLDGHAVDRFELTGVLPGKYVLHAEANGLVGGDVIDQVLGGERTIEVADTHLDGIELALRPPVDLTGEVRFAENCPATPIMVEYASVVPVPGNRAHAIPNAKGAVVFYRLFPGTYSFTTFVRDPHFVASLKLGGSDAPTDGLRIGDQPPAPLQIVIGCEVKRQQVGRSVT